VVGGCRRINFRGSITKPKSKPKAAPAQLLEDPQACISQATGACIVQISRATQHQARSHHRDAANATGTTIAAIMMLPIGSSIRARLSCRCCPQEARAQPCFRATDKGRVYRIKDGKAQLRLRTGLNSGLMRCRKDIAMVVLDTTSAEDEIAHLRVSISKDFVHAGRVSSGDRPCSSDTASMFAVIAYRIQAIASAISITQLGRCWIKRLRRKTTGNVRPTGQLRPEADRAYSRHGSGPGVGSTVAAGDVMADGFAWNGQTMTVCLGRFAITAPNGMDRASLASGTKKINPQGRPGHEGSFRQTVARPSDQIMADFAKLVELFDAQGVSFVSVTQSSIPRLHGPADTQCAPVLCQFERRSPPNASGQDCRSKDTVRRLLATDEASTRFVTSTATSSTFSRVTRPKLVTRRQLSNSSSARQGWKKNCSRALRDISTVVLILRSAEHDAARTERAECRRASKWKSPQPATTPATAGISPVQSEPAAGFPGALPEMRWQGSAAYEIRVRRK